MNNRVKTGFTFLVETLNSQGKLVDSELVHNLMPNEGIAHLLNSLLKGAPGVSQWYIGLYEGNYTPNALDTMSTFPTAAVETTAYTFSQRPAFIGGDVFMGTVDNVDNRPEFVFTANKTIYGGFISSSAAIGGASGILLSVVRFSSPKVVEANGVLRVSAGFSVVSV